MLEILLKYVPDYIFYNKNDNLSAYSHICECMIATIEIESMNEHPKIEDKRIQPVEGDTITIIMGI